MVQRMSCRPFCWNVFFQHCRQLCQRHAPATKLGTHTLFYEWNYTAVYNYCQLCSGNCPPSRVFQCDLLKVNPGKPHHIPQFIIHILAEVRIFNQSFWGFFCFLMYHNDQHWVLLQEMQHKHKVYNSRKTFLFVSIKLAALANCARCLYRCMRIREGCRDSKSSIPILLSALTSQTSIESSLS